jgi:hypothetical protein
MRRLYTYLLIIPIICPERDWEILNCIYVNQSLAGQTLAELTDLHSMNNQKREKEN